MFHEVLFPTAISLGSRGGPERRTDVVTLDSGHEQRNSRWADSRRSYNAGYGVRSLDELHAVLAFFEERRGRLHGFRWRDHADCRSCAPAATPAPLDQQIGIGDGSLAEFQLVRQYGALHAPYRRVIAKPVAGSVSVAVEGVVKAPDTFSIDYTTGVVTFLPGHIPAASAVVTAGYLFDVPVRFDTDRLEVSLDGFRHGAIQSIPIVEVRV